MARWIDESNVDGGCVVGQVGFLVERKPQGRAATWSLRERPARTNRSREPRLFGWYGETNNVNEEAHGLARIARVTTNGRVLVAALTGSERDAALETLGWPELQPQSVAS